MHKLTYEGLVSALRSAGICAGDVVHVQSDLLRIGPVDCGPKREQVLEFYLQAFLDVVGDKGTLSVGTSFEDYGRYGTTFELEHSPSRQGVFSEFIRTRPEARRSIHPIVSVSAIGEKASAVCDGPHFEGFGYQSAWGRLHRLNAKIVALGLGVELEGGTTFFHYLEHLYGVPYQYTKIYDAPVLVKGRRVQGPFTMSVRYLDFGIVNDTLRFKRRLVQKGRATNVPVGAGFLMYASANDIIEEGVSCLDEDRYFLLREPPKFVPGVVPMDGNTGQMREVYDSGSR